MTITRAELIQAYLQIKDARIVSHEMIEFMKDAALKELEKNEGKVKSPAAKFIEICRMEKPDESK